MDQEKEELINYSNKLKDINDQIQKELNDTKYNLYDLSKAQGVFSNNNNDNLIIFQLAMDEILENTYHFLSGDIKVQDPKGRIYYLKCKENERPFSEFGVQRILNELSSYMHKGNFLSYWLEPEDFYPFVRNIVEDISDYIADNFYKLGMDNDDKIKMYPLIVNSIETNIHSSFRRALMGRELNSLRSARLVTQKEADVGSTLGGNNNQLPTSTDKKQFWKLW